jgi:hypothetical protein
LKDTFAKAEKNNKKAEHRNVRKNKRKSILKNAFLFLNILFQQCDFVFIFIQAYEKHLFNETALHNLNDSNLFNEDPKVPRFFLHPFPASSHLLYQDFKT